MALEFAVLVRIVKHNEIRSDGLRQGLNANEAVFTHRYRNMREALLYLQRFVASLGRRVLHLYHPEARCASPVSATEHSQVQVLTQVLDEPLGERCFTAAAHIQVAHYHGRGAGFLRGKQPRIEQCMAYM